VTHPESTTEFHKNNFRFSVLQIASTQARVISVNLQGNLLKVRAIDANLTGA